MFILPIRTNIRPWRTPYTNYALIAANVIVFLLTYLPHRNPYTGSAEALRPWAEQFMLTSISPHLWQFISYAFLHGGFMHIIGNMFFLYLFGNNVNDKLGHFGYLCFYLAGAVFSGIGHTMMGGGPVLGASGAIAAVTGAYLVLFPQSLITILFWLLYFMDTFELSALYFIGFKMIFWDNVLERSVANVAYDAHLAGYVFGILAILGMLGTGLISGNHLDLWSMLKQWNQRRRYRDIVADNYDPFTGQPTVKKIEVEEVKTAVPKQSDERIDRLRNDIARRIAQRNLPAAAELYIELIRLDSSGVLPRQHLLDIANQLAGDKRHVEAARAYEQFLANYGSYEYAEQVELMLGILYCRYLNNRELAVKYLQSAAKKLTDADQLKMCKEELAKLQSV